MKPRKRSSYGRKTRRSSGTSARPAADAADTAPSAQNGYDADGAKQNPVAKKQQICVEILTSGHVQSFVDFFYLMHRPDPNPDPNRPEDADAEIEVPIQQMLDVKDNLTAAEAARRDGDAAVRREQGESGEGVAAAEAQRLHAGERAHVPHVQVSRLAATSHK